MQYTTHKKASHMSYINYLFRKGAEELFFMILQITHMWINLLKHIKQTIITNTIYSKRDNQWR